MENNANSTGRYVPETCLTDGIFDVNRDWPCKRAAFVSHLITFSNDIDATQRRLDRTTNVYKARNLTAWIADAEIRYARLLAFLPEKECSGNHGE